MRHIAGPSCVGLFGPFSFVRDPHIHNSSNSDDSSSRIMCTIWMLKERINNYEGSSINTRILCCNIICYGVLCCAGRYDEVSSDWINGPDTRNDQNTEKY